MTKLIYSLAIIITLFLGLSFAYMNNQTVQLTYLSFKSDVSLALLLLCTLATGIVTGFMVSWLSSWRVRRKLSRTKKELKAVQTASV